MRRLRTLVAAITLGVTLLGSGCGLVPGPAEPQTVYIGGDLPLSGSDAAVGMVHHNALQLRVEQANERQLAGGRRLALRVVDNRSDPATSAENLTRLAGDTQVAAIVTAGCPECVTTDELRVPTISLDPVDVLADAADRRYLFRLGPNAADNADRLSQQMAQADVATVGLITVDDPYGQAGARQMADATDRDGITIATTAQISTDDPGAVTAAAEAIAGWRQDEAAPLFDPETGTIERPASGPDAVVIWVPSPLSAQAVAGLRQAGYDGPVYLDMIAAFDLFLTGDEVAYNGATLVLFDTPVIDQLIASSPAAAARDRWARSYLSRYGTYHMHASWAADAISVFAQAINRAGVAGPAAIRDNLEDTRIDGFTGQIRFTANQHSGLHPTSLSLLVAAGGRWYPQAV